MTAGNSPIIRSGSAPFRAKARLIRLLGEELISDEIMAVVELVKNAYDADAHRVIVSFENITDPEKGLIRIKDDGCGMDLQTVLYSWMEPATHHKRAKGTKKRTLGGRILLGEKGVGRFAADKLGSELDLISRPAGSAEETVVRVGWQHYEHDRYLDEVDNTWFTREPLEFTGEKQGTMLIIRSLRATWNEEMIARLHNGLVRLVSPSTTDMDFVIEVNSPEFPFINGRVINRLVETAPYRLAGQVDRAGIFSFSGKVHQLDLKPLCNGHFATAEGTVRTPVCGSFSLSLNIWDLEPLTGRGFGVDKKTRDAVKSSCGVSIYRDGFRVWPYGEKDDDWLELNQRRVNNPTLRVSNNQIIGYVEITHDENPELRDRTSREGLIDTQAFFDLRALVLAALSELETERFAKRRESTPQHPPATDKEESDELLQFIISSKTARNNESATKNIIQEMERLYRQKIEEERQRYNQVSKLAGIGMAAELMTDVFSREIDNTQTILNILKGQLQADPPASPGLKELVATLTEQFEKISEKLDIMGPLYRAITTDNEPVDLSATLYDSVSILSGKLVDNKIKVTYSGARGLSIRMNRGHLMQVLMILLENALNVLKVAGVKEPIIEIEFVVENGFTGIRIADNGPGIATGIKHLIFQPYFSTRQSGRGLGLHVARDILNIYNCSLEQVEGKSRQPGACFEIKFDLRRVIKHV